MELERLAPASPFRLSTKTHAFRRGGISNVRRHCVRLGFCCGDGLLIFLRVFGRWKSSSSVLQYLVLEKDEMVNVLRGQVGGLAAPSASASGDMERDFAALAEGPEPSDAAASPRRGIGYSGL